MSGVQTRAVAREEAELRLDRWFRRHFPQLGHGQLQKLLRTGQVRLDGKRVAAGTRLSPGQTIRVPPLPDPGDLPARPTSAPGDLERLRAMVVHEDDVLIVLDKPPGLAVQGGTRTHQHVDGMLAALTTARGERPRLVHRLDRDTSGLLVVAKGAAAAAKLGQAFRRHRVDKLYWALAVGHPADRGTIDQPLAKRAAQGGERVDASTDGQTARTAYRVVARASNLACWLALKPLTGRTHQLRVHLALLGHPIIGDRKYGDPTMRLAGAPEGLMLHARELRLPHPDGGVLQLTAPPSAVLRAGFAWLGFEIDATLPGVSLASFDLP